MTRGCEQSQLQCGRPSHETHSSGVKGEFAGAMWWKGTFTFRFLVPLLQLKPLLWKSLAQQKTFCFCFFFSQQQCLWWLRLFGCRLSSLRCRGCPWRQHKRQFQNSLSRSEREGDFFLIARAGNVRATAAFRAIQSSCNYQFPSCQPEPCSQKMQLPSCLCTLI